MLRVCLVAAIVITGAVLGGVYGAFLAFILCGVVGAMIGPPQPRQVRVARTPSLPAEEQTDARKGRRDPTAPTPDEWGGMMQNLKRRV